MKTYRNLYENFISEDNIRLSIHNSALGKKKRCKVMEIVGDVEGSIPLIEDYATHFRNKRHKPKQIYDGIVRKVRYIIVPSYKEQIVHHMIVNALMPMFTKGMYEHSYGSIPGRGGHRGKKTIEKWIRKGGRNIKYCMKLDIRKYFDSVPHDTLKRKLSAKVKDEQLLKVLFEIIDVVPEGLPLGFYTSQWLANWYLHDLDHYIKEDLKAVYYIRYMDDMVIFGSNKKKLRSMKTAIADYLATLGLELKSNWQIFRFDHDGKGRDLDFMGFRFFRNRTILRRSIMLRACRKARKIYKKSILSKVTEYDCMQMLSYLGWIKATNVYHMYEERIKPYVDFGKCKKRISKYQRRMNRWNGTDQATATV